MITLAIGQVLWGLAFRWAAVTGGDNGLSGLNRPAPFGIDLGGADAVLLLHARDRGRGRRCDRVADRFGLRRAAARHARPAAAHERARPQRVAGEVPRVHRGGLLRRRVGVALHLLQQVHPPAIAQPHRLGRGTAHGDRGRLGHARRARSLARPSSCCSRITCRPTSSAGPCCSASCSWRSCCSCPTAWCRDWDAHGQGCRAGDAHDRRAGAQRPFEVLWRTACDEPCFAFRGARRAQAHHRAERRGQDDALQPDHRRPAPRRRNDPALRRRGASRARAQARAPGHGAHLPDHHSVSARHAGAQRGALAARIEPRALESVRAARGQARAVRARIRGARAGRPRARGSAPAGRAVVWREAAGGDRHGARAAAPAPAAR